MIEYLFTLFVMAFLAIYRYASSGHTKEARDVKKQPDTVLPR